MRPEGLCGLLAEPDRLAVFAAVVLGAGTPNEVAGRAGLPARNTVSALRRLEQGGLVSTVEGKLIACAEAFKDSIREYAIEPASVDDPLVGSTGDPSDRERAAMLRAFVRDGRLVHLPTHPRKLRIVLEHIVVCFEPGVKYPERAVDAILRAWHPDHASLRRYLIDADLLAREDGVYWRTGGLVDV